MQDFNKEVNSIKEGSDPSKVAEALLESMKSSSIISKRRAQSHVKEKIKGKRADGMPITPFTIYAVSPDGERTEVKTVNDFNSFSSKFTYLIEED